MQKIVQDLPISANVDITDSVDDDSKVPQASGMPDGKLWTRGDQLRNRAVKCQQARCTSDSLQASGKFWGAESNSSLREQVERGSPGSSVRSIA